MSQFSGKCDFYDNLIIHGDGNIEKGFEYFKDSHIYIEDMEHPLIFHSLAELVPYFPYVVTIGAFDNTNGANTTVVLTKESWVEMHKDTMCPGAYKYYTDNLKKEMQKYKKD